MAKQIKIGFDRIPVPAEQTLEPLLDINTGMPLKDAGGQQIYTQEPTAILSFGVSKNSTPVIVNDGSSPLKVVEQFPSTTEVSSSLLGIPRAETQLGLFADVSTYGLDSNSWDTFSYDDTTSNPIQWQYRKNATYGNRHPVQLEEISNEQALALTAFPTPWTYPYGPNFADVGGYNKDLFVRYKNFIQLGNALYDYYVIRGFVDFANKNFLSSQYAIPFGSNDVQYQTNTYSIDTIFEEIEKWTIAWMQLRDNELYDLNRNKVYFSQVPGNFDASNTIPGYSSQARHYGELTSRKAFRYQPGRASGFTMGVRASSDAGSASNIIEWGCANDTDEYMFQLKGSQFNIVRRSVIPLPEANLNRMGLKKEDQKAETILNPIKTAAYKTYTNDTNNKTGDQTRWETVIPRDKFNGDPLNGNGQSGYIISFEQVTMWKVEFSWYGAIGAKFYVYTPTGNGDARWIMVHHLIIENELGQPCLGDPFFKFKYVLALQDTSNLRFPQYVYKYGASYYIDGGDEGTTTGHSYSSNVVSTFPGETRSVLGITAKDYIKNSDGISISNRKDIIPQTLTITATTPTQIDIIDCEGCPGFGHHYAPSLQHYSVTSNIGTTGIIGDLTISIDGQSATFIPNDPTQVLTIPPNTYKKIVADGIYSSYLYQSGSELRIARRNANSIISNEIQKNADFSKISLTKLANGTSIPIKGQVFKNTRLTGFDDIIVSSQPLTKDNINVNFLNPINRDNGQYAEFFIAVTNLAPGLSSDPVTGLDTLQFNGLPLDQGNLLYADFAQYSASKDISGLDVTEWDPRYGPVFGLDPRLAQPRGTDSGICSQAKINVIQENFDTVYSSTNPVTGSSGFYLIFDQESGFNNYTGLSGGEIGKLSGTEYVGSGVYFVSNNAVEYRDTNTNSIKFYIDVNGPLVGVTKIAIKIVSIQGRFISKSKTFTWNVHPLYVVIGMRDGSQVNNITLDEYDDVTKFSYSPNWIKSSNCKIKIINSNSGAAERVNSSTGLFEAPGLSFPGNPPTNFVESFRLDSAQVDTQLQQPLRPGEVRTSVFLGENETAEFDLRHVFGQDRYTVTPGLLNAKATFITAKALNESGEVQINLQSKEQ
jgi:hypothetical protein